MSWKSPPLGRHLLDEFSIAPGQIQTGVSERGDKHLSAGKAAFQQFDIYNYSAIHTLTAINSRKSTFPTVFSGGIRVLEMMRACAINAFESVLRVKGRPRTRGRIDLLWVRPENLSRTCPDSVLPELHSAPPQRCTVEGEEYNRIRISCWVKLLKNPWRSTLKQPGYSTHLFHVFLSALDISRGCRRFSYVVHKHIRVGHSGSCTLRSSSLSPAGVCTSSYI